MTHTYAFAFDLANNAQAQAFAQIAQLAAIANIPFAPVGVSGGNAQVSAPAAPTQDAPKERKPLAPATDVELPITRVKAPKGMYAFTLGAGAGKAGAKLQIKDGGFKWDASFAEEGVRYGAWVGTAAQAKALGLTAKSDALTVTASWVQAGRDKAAAKAARRAAK